MVWEASIELFFQQDGFIESFGMQQVLAREQCIETFLAGDTFK